LVTVAVSPLFYSTQFRFKLKDWQAFYQHLGIEQFTEFTELVDESFVELSELLKVNGPPLGSNLVIVWKPIVGVGLMNFFMTI
jgi:hypothetical protein